MSKDCKKCDPKTKKVSSIPTGTKTPLMKVARDGDTKRVDTLIKNGANIDRTWLILLLIRTKPS